MRGGATGRVLVMLASWLIPAVHGAENLKVDTRIFDANARQLVAKVSQQGDLKDFFAWQKQFTYQLLEKMGIQKNQLSPATIQAIETPHTTNLNAFVAFSLGLDLRDKGRYQESAEAFRLAQQHDPSFALAGKFARETPKFDQKTTEMIQSAVSQGIHGVPNALAPPGKGAAPSWTPPPPPPPPPKAGPATLAALVEATKGEVKQRVENHQKNQGESLAKAVKTDPQRASQLMQDALRTMPPDQALASVIQGLQGSKADGRILHKIVDKAVESGLSIDGAKSVMTKIQESTPCR